MTEIIRQAPGETLYPAAAGHLVVEHQGYKIHWVPGRFTVAFNGWHVDEFSSYTDAIVFVGECAARDTQLARDRCNQVAGGEPLHTA